jgi:hypothetical protein
MGYFHDIDGDEPISHHTRTQMSSALEKLESNDTWKSSSESAAESALGKLVIEN